MLLSVSREERRKSPDCFLHPERDQFLFHTPLDFHDLSQVFFLLFSLNKMKLKRNLLQHEEQKTCPAFVLIQWNWWRRRKSHFNLILDSWKVESHVSSVSGIFQVHNHLDSCSKSRLSTMKSGDTNKSKGLAFNFFSRCFPKHSNSSATSLNNKSNNSLHQQQSPSKSKSSQHQDLSASSSSTSSYSRSSSISSTSTDLFGKRYSSDASYSSQSLSSSFNSQTDRNKYSAQPSYDPRSEVTRNCIIGAPNRSIRDIKQ